ncbi:MAG TPA: hypothetical protein VKE22_23515 [Haliangiales bacterium]|nr:hypothetical protein [Haliangiales bacterium]
MRAALALLLGALGGCSADFPSLYIQQNQVPGTGCVVSTSGTTFLSEGVLDTNNDPSGALNLGYVFTPLIINAIAADSSNPTLHIAFLTGADVEIRPGRSARSAELVAALAAQGLTKHTALFSATVKPGGSVALVFHLTDLETTAAIRQFLGAGELVQTVAHIVIDGTVDGRSVSSYPFDYPLSFCVGCLVADVGLCAALPTGFAGSEGGACNRLQDNLLQCCDNFKVCPAKPPAM